MEIGNIDRARNELRAAIAQYRLALALFEWNASVDPKSIDGRLGVGMMHHNIGAVHHSTDVPTAALQDLEKALTFYQPILD